MDQETTRGQRRSPSRRGSAGSKSTAAREPKESGEKQEGAISRLLGIATGRREEPAPPETDPIRMLTKDHDRVRDLFKEFEKAGEGAKATRQRIVEKISRELEIHAQLEEKVFYQAFRSVAEKDPKKLVRESFEEHKIVKTLVAELASMTPDDPQFEAKVTVLKEAVEHHADEEEDELFPAAKKLFDDEKLDELGRQMAAMKEKLQRSM